MFNAYWRDHLHQAEYLIIWKAIQMLGEQGERGEQGRFVGWGARAPRCSVASVLMLSGCLQAGAAAPAGALPQAHLHHAGGADEGGPRGGEEGAEGATASPHPAHLETQLCGERPACTTGSLQPADTHT